MSDSKSANADFNAMGRKKDSSGIYFDKDGKPLVQADFKQPFADGEVAKNDLLNQLKNIPSFKIDKGYYTFLKKDHPSASFKITYTTQDYKGVEGSQVINVSFKDTADENKNQGMDKFTRRVQTEWWFKDEVEYRLKISEVDSLISSETGAWASNNCIARDDAKYQLAEDQKNKDELQKADVKEVATLLGVSSEDALAYLAAGHTVDQAASKVAKWNLASPSSRQLMIAQDAVSSSEDSSRAFEVKGSTGNVIPKQNYVPTDDLYKEIRNPYSERRATKAYIALVKDNTNTTQAIEASKGLGIQTLLRLTEFYMQGVSEMDSEKYQIVETFNKPKIYFFDRRARVYSYSFTVENTGKNTNTDLTDEIPGNHWRDKFKKVYDEYLRGTKSVENKVKAVIHFDEVTRIGYVLSCSMSMNAQNDNLADINITMFVEDEKQREVNIDINQQFDTTVEVRSVNATLMDENKTLSYICGDYAGTNASLTSLVVTDYIKNNNSPGRETFPLGKCINVKLVEIFDDETEPTVGSALPGSGGCVIKSIMWSALDGSITEKSNPELDGILVCVNDYKSGGMNEGSEFAVPKSGIKLFVAIDTSAKLAQYIGTKQGNASVSVAYLITLASKDNDIPFRISGSISLAPKVLDIKVSSPGKAQAKEMSTKNGTVVKLQGCDSWESVITESGNKSKIFTASFEAQVIDKKTNTVVAISDSQFAAINLKVTDIKGSITKEDSSFVSGIVNLTRKNDNTLTCKAQISCVMTDQILAFTGESCTLTGTTKVGNTDFNVEMNFKREQDTKDYKILAVVPETNKGILMSPDNIVYLDSRVDIIFDSDPGAGISKELQFIFGSTIATSIAPGSGEAQVNALLYTRLIMYSYNVDSTNNFNVSTRIDSLSAVKKVSSGDALKLYKITSESDVYVISMNLAFFNSKTYRDIARLSSKVIGRTLNNYAELDTVRVNGTLKIAKTSMQSSVAIQFINSSKEKISIDTFQGVSGQKSTSGVGYGASL